MNHTTIGHQLLGNGATKVIALHSWMDDAQSWSTAMPFFNPEKYTYAFMDIRGYGTSKNIPSEYNIEEIKNDIFQLAKELGFSKFHLIGHSMCGMVAQYAALKDKDNKIEKVVLVTPVAASGFPADEEAKGFFKSIVQNVEVAKMGYSAFTSNRYSDYWYSIRAERHVKVTDKNAQLSYMDMWLYENFSDEMLAVEKLFLVVSGAYDHPMFRLAAQKNNFEGFKKIEFVECENAGHFPMQEAPVFLVSEIEKFLN